jgi:arabinose-5-phosphate isomerase
MIKELLQQQKKSLDYFFHHIDEKQVKEIVDVLSKCTGLIYFTGVGKSALVAKKIALTLTSTGTRALYLGATGAVHGDLGIVRPGDVFVFISKSGESEELINLVPFLRNKGITLISIVSNSHSRLAKACQHNLILPLDKELCPFNMAPTTSSLIQMLIGDVFVVSLMLIKKIPLDQYKLYHPAGRIGKRLTLKVNDLMITGDGVPLCKPDDKLVDTLVELSNKKCGCLLVVNDRGILQGIYTDGDLRRSLQTKGTEALVTPLRELMNANPRFIQADVMALEALHIMEADQKSPIMVLPVLDDHRKVIGIIKMHDIVQSGI